MSENAIFSQLQKQNNNKMKKLHLPGKVTMVYSSFRLVAYDEVYLLLYYLKLDFCTKLPIIILNTNRIPAQSTQCCNLRVSGVPDTTETAREG